MLTISQLAAYAGVTVAVVRLIRIHVLAGSGVPLSQVEDLLDADHETFAEQVRGIDARLRAEVRNLQDTRRRLAQLAAGEHLALPASVVGYLDRLRRLGVGEPYLERERDAWIIIAAQVPEDIDAIITRKHEHLHDPDVVRLYSLVSTAPDWTADDPRVVEVADILDRLTNRAAESDDLGHDHVDEQVAALLDAAAAETSPAVERLFTLLEERGWRGLTRLESLTVDGASAPRGSSVIPRRTASRQTG